MTSVEGRRARTFVLIVFLGVVGAWHLSAQAPLPLPGQPATAGGRGRGGGSPAIAANLPASPVVSAVAAISAEVTGPGPAFSSLMDLPSGDDLILGDAAKVAF